MKTTSNKNKTSISSFHGKVFFNTIIFAFALVTFACKKDAPIIAQDDELAATPTWNGFTLDTIIGNTVLGSSTKAIDVDKDRRADFELQFFVETDGTYSITLFGSGDNKVVSLPNAILKSFKSEDIINSHAQTWQNGASLVIHNDVSINVIDDNNRGGYSIVGVYFKKDGTMHYGWMRLKLSLVRGNGIPSVMLNDFGYEVQENKAIKAGLRTDV